MVHILGVQLPDHQIARYALTHFYGIGHKTSHRLCARLQIHDTCKVEQLSPSQVTSLAAFPLRARKPRLRFRECRWQPRNTDRRRCRRRSSASPVPRPSSRRPPRPSAPLKNGSRGGDPLRNLKIEADLKREMRENIAHQRMIGSYVGKRHAMGLPVRGQNTQTNAKTAKKLNRVERHH
ncbi:hypothetical protein EVG20_g10680 [Dentipellis fragilis]|uniref:Small ribosomal subunit protein uS13m n=1 Tax=Dentipellis fragilis TaxID=205917 RepID=A0A4Y9XRZ2_9AGAM|nr:hypothetical protein EVG20_g10680 [Dentipellis fragilis]